MEISAQEIYDRVREEVLRRFGARGTEPPSELEIFKKVVAFTRAEIAAGTMSPEMLEELQEVKPAALREVEAKQKIIDENSSKLIIEV